MKIIVQKYSSGITQMSKCLQVVRIQMYNFLMLFFPVFIYMTIL